MMAPTAWALLSGALALLGLWGLLTPSTGIGRAMGAVLMLEAGILLWIVYGNAWGRADGQAVVHLALGALPALYLVMLRLCASPEEDAGGEEDV